MLNCSERDCPEWHHLRFLQRCCRRGGATTRTGQCRSAGQTGKAKASMLHLSQAELQALLSEKGLPTEGKKYTLIKRLTDAQKSGAVEVAVPPRGVPAEGGSETPSGSGSGSAAASVSSRDAAASTGGSTSGSTSSSSSSSSVHEDGRNAGGAAAGPAEQGASAPPEADKLASEPASTPRTSSPPDTAATTSAAAGIQKGKTLGIFVKSASRMLAPHRPATLGSRPADTGQSSAPPPRPPPSFASHAVPPMRAATPQPTAAPAATAASTPAPACTSPNPGPVPSQAPAPMVHASAAQPPMVGPPPRGPPPRVMPTWGPAPESWHAQTGYPVAPHAGPPAQPHAPHSMVPADAAPYPGAYPWTTPQPVVATQPSQVQLPAAGAAQGDRELGSAWGDSIRAAAGREPSEASRYSRTKDRRGRRHRHRRHHRSNGETPAAAPPPEAERDDAPSNENLTARLAALSAQQKDGKAKETKAQATPSANPGEAGSAVGPSARERELRLAAAKAAVAGLPSACPGASGPQETAESGGPSTDDLMARYHALGGGAAVSSPSTRRRRVSAASPDATEQVERGTPQHHPHTATASSAPAGGWRGDGVSEESAEEGSVGEDGLAERWKREDQGARRLHGDTGKQRGPRGNGRDRASSGENRSECGSEGRSERRSIGLDRQQKGSCARRSSRGTAAGRESSPGRGDVTCNGAAPVSRSSGSMLSPGNARCGGSEGRRASSPPPDDPMERIVPKPLRVRLLKWCNSLKVRVQDKDLAIRRDRELRDRKKELFAAAAQRQVEISQKAEQEIADLNAEFEQEEAEDLAKQRNRSAQLLEIANAVVMYGLRAKLESVVEAIDGHPIVLESAISAFGVVLPKALEHVRSGRRSLHSASDGRGSPSPPPEVSARRRRAERDARITEVRRQEHEELMAERAAEKEAQASDHELIRIQKAYKLREERAQSKHAATEKAKVAKEIVSWNVDLGHIVNELQHNRDLSSELAQVLSAARILKERLPKRVLDNVAADEEDCRAELQRSTGERSSRATAISFGGVNGTAESSRTHPSGGGGGSRRSVGDGNGGLGNGGCTGGGSVGGKSGSVASSGADGYGDGLRSPHSRPSRPSKSGSHADRGRNHRDLDKRTLNEDRRLATTAKAASPAVPSMSAAAQESRARQESGAGRYGSRDRRVGGGTYGADSNGVRASANATLVKKRRQFASMRPRRRPRPNSPQGSERPPLSAMEGEARPSFARGAGQEIPSGGRCRSRSPQSRERPCPSEDFSRGPDGKRRKTGDGERRRSPLPPPPPPVPHHGSGGGGGRGCNNRSTSRHRSPCASDRRGCPKDSSGGTSHHAVERERADRDAQHGSLRLAPAAAAGKEGPKRGRTRWRSQSRPKSRSCGARRSRSAPRSPEPWSPPHDDDHGGDEYYSLPNVGKGPTSGGWRSYIGDRQLREKASGKLGKGKAGKSGKGHWRTRRGGLW